MVRGGGAAFYFHYFTKCRGGVLGFSELIEYLICDLPQLKVILYTDVLNINTIQICTDIRRALLIKVFNYYSNITSNKT